MLELLVTTAVIGLLAGLVLASLSRGKQSVKRTQCLNNLRQIVISARMYWDENRGRPFPYRGGFTNGGDLYWFGWIERGSEGMRRFDRQAGFLAPYITASLEVCPAFEYRNSQTKLKATGASYGYGYNLHLASWSGNVEQVSTPSGKIAFADAAQVNDFQAPASPDRPMLEEFYYLNSSEKTAHFRHRGRANSGFLDGHVDAQKMMSGTRDDRMPSENIGRLEMERMRVP